MGQAKGVRFAVRVAQIIDEKPQVKAMIYPILIVWRVVDAQLAYLTQRLGQYARESAVCRLLTTTPGVGPLTASAMANYTKRDERHADTREAMLQAASDGDMPPQFRGAVCDVEMSATVPIMAVTEALRSAFLFPEHVPTEWR